MDEANKYNGGLGAYADNTHKYVSGTEVNYVNIVEDMCISYAVYNTIKNMGSCWKFDCNKKDGSKIILKEISDIQGHCIGDY